MESIHLIVDLRNHEDISLLQKRIDALEAEKVRLKGDIYTMSSYAVQLQEASDEIRRLRRILKSHGISY